ncbi:hypothetical protein Pmar_PMAR014815 [Perkinsus marinus ATCC 50983]|uniref:Uncharacterized protein n=1 Tax=Perkinsus marinus (strain ATCC 50983 / TXsc) TaxID=423536 RepID=C5LT12_PERM5|nr:hypothetical protein Pmar_PMAR014815 [Perkinsus marinus ATCC 50983]EER00149.1 hypothetical protein Pmar_PMAR014815 [Perkinsus marinus ATCC 50983]|eukprot:XP_002767431.1 hypothetical protein Pmar_PMAR014815 [Perkinsus marinus ATCC 50983]
MLRDGYIVDAGVDEPIAYRHCERGFDKVTIREDGSAEAAIPVVVANADFKDEVEVLYTVNRLIPGIEPCTEVRIVLKATQLALEEDAPKSGGLTMVADLNQNVAGEALASAVRRVYPDAVLAHG